MYWRRVYSTTEIHYKKYLIGNKVHTLIGLKIFCISCNMHMFTKPHTWMMQMCMRKYFFLATYVHTRDQYPPKYLWDQHADMKEKPNTTM